MYVRSYSSYIHRNVKHMYVLILCMIHTESLLAVCVHILWALISDDQAGLPGVRIYINGHFFWWIINMYF